MLPKNSSWYIFLFLVAVVFWFNIGSNKSTFEYIMVINNANTSTNTFDIVQNAQTDIGKNEENEEVISYVIIRASSKIS